MEGETGDLCGRNKKEQQCITGFSGENLT